MAQRINSGSKNSKSINNTIAQNYTWHTNFPKHYNHSNYSSMITTIILIQR